MAMMATGVFTAGDYTLIKGAGIGDTVVVSNNGPGVIYLTAQSLGKDQKLLPKSFVAWRFEIAVQNLSIHVENGTAEVTVQWTPAEQRPVLPR